MFNSLHSSTNQELFEKHPCNQGSHHEKHGGFLLCKGSHHVQPQNPRFSLSAKMKRTQRRTLVSPWRIHCMYCSIPKSRLESIMLQNLPIMLLSISPIFCLLCLLLCFSDMHYAFVFVTFFHVKCSFYGNKVNKTLHQIIDICSNPHGVLIRDLENKYI